MINKTYKEYEPKNIVHMRTVVPDDTLKSLLDSGVSISVADISNGSPQQGDMIAMNENNPNDKWLISKDFFNSHYKKKGE